MPGGGSVNGSSNDLSHEAAIHDLFDAFVVDCCTLERGKWVTSTVLHNAFMDYCMHVRKHSSEWVHEHIAFRAGRTTDMAIKRGAALRGTHACPIMAGITVSNYP